MATKHESSNTLRCANGQARLRSQDVRLVEGVLHEAPQQRRQVPVGLLLEERLTSESTESGLRTT